jgi:hypothetical protein
MFIVCPSCSGPYNVPAAQIAPLVQVACPHCEYRLILDFEAANDPALREPGHQFAQGYENAEAYFSVYSHVTKSPGVQPFAAPGIAGGAVSAPPVAEVRQPATPAAQAQAQAAAGTAGLGAMAPSSGRGAKTVIQSPSKKPVAIDPAGEALAPRPKQPSGPTIRPGQNTEAVPEPVSTTIPPSSTDAVPERKPPHTPPVSGAISSGPSTPEPTKSPDAAAESNSQLSAKPGETKGPEPIKAEETPAVKTPDKPVAPAETSSSKWIGIIIVLILIGVGIALFVMYNKG